MSQARIKSTGGKSVQKKPGSKTTNGKWSGKQQLIIASLIIATILFTVGIFYYFAYVSPMQKVVCEVGDDTIKMGYFIKRTWIAQRELGTEIRPFEFLKYVLARELIIKQGAAKLGITVTDEEIETSLRNEARGQSGTISKREFEEWYRQLRNNSNMTKAEYNDYTLISLLVDKIHNILLLTMDTTIEHIYLYETLLDTDEQESVWDRNQAGEELSDITKEIWLEREPGEQILEVGWVPMDIAFETFGWEITDLDNGEVSEPIWTGEQRYSIIMIAEKTFLEVDEEYKDTLVTISFNSWVEAEVKLTVPKYHGRSNGYDSVTEYWVKLKIAEMSQTIAAESQTSTAE